MDNKPVLYWTPALEPTTFGVGGEVSNAPLCACSEPMTHVGIFPQGENIWQLFYCFECAQDESVCLSSTEPLQGACLRSLTPQEHQDVLVELEASQDIPFVPYESTAMSMAEQPGFGQVSVGEGVYTMGLSPLPLPACPYCQSPMPLLIHIDSLAHENIMWEGMQSLVVFKCPRHNHAQFSVYA